MTKKDMIAKVQEVKEGYKGTLSLLGAAKLRFRKYNTADIERLMIEVSADYNEVLRLEKEYFKPRNLKADMEFAIEDIETMDAHNFERHRPTVRMYIKKLEEKEEKTKKFDAMEEQCKNEVVPTLEKNGAEILDVYVFGGDRVAIDFKINGTEYDLTYVPETGEILTELFGKLLSLTLAELNEKMGGADDTIQQKKHEQITFLDSRGNKVKAIVVSCKNPHLKTRANWELVETCDGKFWEIWKTVNGYLVAVDTDDYENPRLNPPTGHTKT